MEPKNELSIVKNLINYFNAKVIGSYLFVQDGLLKVDDTNDIDFLVEKSKKENVRKFLNDNGYKETQIPYSRTGYEYREGSFIFEKENNPTIDITICNRSKEKFEVKELHEVFGLKFKRGTKSDFIQLSKIIKNADS